jgi:hypothetical protein
MNGIFNIDLFIFFMPLDAITLYLVMFNKNPKISFWGFFIKMLKQKDLKLIKACFKILLIFMLITFIVKWFFVIIFNVDRYYVSVHLIITLRTILPVAFIYSLFSEISLCCKLISIKLFSLKRVLVNTLASIPNNIFTFFLVSFTTYFVRIGIFAFMAEHSLRWVTFVDVYILLDNMIPVNLCDPGDSPTSQYMVGIRSPSGETTTSPRPVDIIRGNYLNPSGCNTSVPNNETSGLYGYQQSHNSRMASIANNYAIRSISPGMSSNVRGAELPELPGSSIIGYSEGNLVWAKSIDEINNLAELNGRLSDLRIQLENNVNNTEVWNIIHNNLMEAEAKKISLCYNSVAYSNWSEAQNYNSPINNVNAPINPYINNIEAPVDYAINNGNAPVDYTINNGNAPVDYTINSWNAPINPNINNIEAPFNPGINNWEAPINPYINNIEAPLNPAINNWEAPINPYINNIEAPFNPAINNWDAPINPDINNWDATINPDISNIEAPFNPDINNWDAPINPDINNWEAPLNPAIVNLQDTLDPDMINWEAPLNPTLINWETPVDLAMINWETPLAPATINWETITNSYVNNIEAPGNGYTSNIMDPVNIPMNNREDPVNSAGNNRMPIRIARDYANLNLPPYSASRIPAGAINGYFVFDHVPSYNPRASNRVFALKLVAAFKAQLDHVYTQRRGNGFHLTSQNVDKATSTWILDSIKHRNNPLWLKLITLRDGTYDIDYTNIVHALRKMTITYKFLDKLLEVK